MNLSFPKPPRRRIPLKEAETQNFHLRRPQLPADWAEEHFKLTTAYARPGALTLFPWQREPLNAIKDHDLVVLCGCVQTGKSLIAEAATGWIIDNRPMNAMICYAKRDTAKDIFEERLRPMVEQVPAIRKYWNGEEDRLTQRKITLNHMLLRVASAESKSDIATYSAGYIYASEVAKYPKKDFDQVKALFGRQEGYRILGTTKAMLESSPDEEGDPLHRTMFQKGVVNLQPYVPCPHCKKYQVLVDEQIKETPNDKGEFDHNPDRIRSDNAAQYECVHCKKIIPESCRKEIGKKVRWAPSYEAVRKKRKPSRAVSFQWNRLVDYSFKFSECLARFFEARQSVNPVALKTYQNEDMAKFAPKHSKRFSTNWLMSKRKDYQQNGDTAGYPKEVLVLTVGIDTQDAGFYYVVRGWGFGMESWLVKHDFIECNMKDDAYKERSNVLNEIKKHLINGLPARLDGVILPIRFGMIDRGGHRHKDVDYVSGRLSFLHAYVGTTQKTAPLIKKSEKQLIYLGHTENLSKIVEAYSESEIWHLPEDVGDDYLQQFLKQYWEEKVDRSGNVKTDYVHGGADHLRDCENLNIASSEYLQLPARLFDNDAVAQLRLNTKAPSEEKKEERKQPERRTRAVRPKQDYLNRYRNR